MSEKSELGVLLEKNAYGDGLTSEEKNRAMQLINEAELTKEDCRACYRPKEKAIYDTGLCRGHASYALLSGK